MSADTDAAGSRGGELPGAGVVELPGAFGGHPGPVFALAFSPDSRLLASGGWDGTIRLWSAETGAPISLLTGHFGSVLALGFAEDGNTLISVGRDRTVRRWDVVDGSHSVTNLNAPRAKFIGAWIGPPGDEFVIAALCADASLLVFAGDTGVQLAELVEVTTAAFHPGGDLTVVHYDGVTALWRRPTRYGEPPLPRQHTGVPNIKAAAHAPDGSRLALAEEDGVIQLWDQTPGSVRGIDVHSETPITRLALDGSRLFVGFSNGGIGLYDLAAGTAARSIPPSGSPVLALCRAPNDAYLATAWDDGRVGIWPLRTDGEGHADFLLPARPVWCFGHRSEIVSVAHAADGSWLATGDIRGEIRIWETRRGRLERVLSSGSTPVEWLSVSPDGSRLGAVINRTLLVWDLDGSSRHPLLSDDSRRLSASFAASGSTLYWSAGADIKQLPPPTDQDDALHLGSTAARGAVQAMAVSSNRDLALAFEDGIQFAADRYGFWPLQGARRVAFGPRGDVLAVGTRDGEVWLRHLTSGATPVNCSAHRGQVNALVFSPTEPILAGCGEDGTVTLWDAQTLAPIRTLIGHLGAVRDLSFGPDGQTLVSVGDDGRIVEWGVRTGTPLRGSGLVIQPMPPVPGLRNDSPSAVDLLGMADDVRTLATLIAATGTRPPLAIALLGEWGSGKSSVLLQVHDMVGLLTAQSRALPGASLFAANVRQVRFNAWHYSDDQVWTGLVDHLFRALADDPELEEPAPDAATVEQARGELGRRLDERQRDLAVLTARALTERRTADAASAIRRNKLLLILGTASAAVAVGGRVAIRWVLAHVGITLDSARSGWQQGRALAEDANSIGGSLDAEIAQTRADVGALEDRLAQISAAARLALLLRKQSDPNAYADSRGLIGRVHSDLRQLDEALRALRDEQRAGVVGSQPPLERIVLYIDDLDRCSPERVLQVLAAVHLMLALPLFVVVVAIDPRWLLNALRTHYGSLLPEFDGDGADPDAGALDYLDKIFQIPYVITKPATPAMGEYLRALLGAEPTARNTGSDVERTAGADKAGVPTSPQSTRPASDRTAASRPQPQATPSSAPDDRARSAPTLPRELPDLRPGGLVLRPVEADFMARLAPLVDTPRAGKKLANLYRLARIGIADDELRAFIEDEDYRSVQILLAILVGEPAAAATVFAAIRAAEPNVDLVTAIREAGPYSLGAPRNPASAAACVRVADLLAPILDPLPDKRIEAAAFQRWCPQLARYSFHTLSFDGNSTGTGPAEPTRDDRDPIGLPDHRDYADS